MKRLLVCLAAVAAFVGLAVAPASAATGWNRCPAGSFCIFDLPNGQGGIAWFKFGSPDLRGQGMDNRTSAWWNRNQEAFALCDGYNRVGQLLDIFPGAQGNAQPHFAHADNRASSVAMYAHGCN